MSRYEEFVQHYYTYVFKIAYAVLKHRQDAEDVTQEVFVQVYKSLSQYRQQGFRTWLSRIAVNRAIDYKRRKDKGPQTEQIENEGKRVYIEQEGNDLEADYIRKERIRKITDELTHLPIQYQDIIRSFYMEQKSYVEIAEQSGLEVKSVESKLYRARLWLKRHWRKEEFE